MLISLLRLRIHEIAIGVIAMLVSGTCIYLLVLES